MKEIRTNIYTSLDSLFDTKLVVLKELIPEELHEKFIKEKYKDLRLFNFDLPEYDITNDMYFERWEQRDNSTLARAELSNLRSELSGIGIKKLWYNDIEDRIGVPNIYLTVNIWPYQLSGKLLEMIKELIVKIQAFPCNVDFVNIPFNEVGTNEYNRFHLVIDQGLNIDKQQSKKFVLDLEHNQTQNTAYLMPCVSLKLLDNGEFLDPEQPIIVMGLLLGPRVKGYEGIDFSTFQDCTI